MSTSHRGLPPPAAMALPGHSPPPNPGQLPDVWQHGTEETQRTFLQAKSNEEKRRQEEERTKQESFRLEIRRTELEMLREAFRGGIPPHLVPIIFTGGGAFAGTSAEWASHYISQLNNQQQILQNNIVSPPDSRLESRLLTAAEHSTPRPGPLSSATQTPGQPIPAHISPSPAHNLNHAQNNQYPPFAGGLLSARNHPQPTHTAEPPKSSLPRINTNEVRMQPLPQGPPPGLSLQLSGIPPPIQPLNQAITSHQHAQAHSVQPQLSEQSRQPESSPIFFHHWQPPSTQSSAAMASTSPASGKNLESSLFPSQPYIASQESSTSPKKRKFASSGHSIPPSVAAGPPPSIQSPSFSSYSPGSNKRRSTTAAAHSRQRSDSGSARGYEPYPKNPITRPRRQDVGGITSDSSGATAQYPLSHMSSSEASPVTHLKESTGPPQNPMPQEPSIPHLKFQAGPEGRRDHRSHQDKDNESSVSGGSAPPPRDI